MAVPLLDLTRQYRPLRDDIRAAIDRGIAFVETGANYGGEEGISEKRIGLAMGCVDANKLAIMHACDKLAATATIQGASEGNALCSVFMPHPK